MHQCARSGVLVESDPVITVYQQAASERWSTAIKVRERSCSVSESRRSCSKRGHRTVVDNNDSGKRRKEKKDGFQWRRAISYRFTRCLRPVDWLRPERTRTRGHATRAQGSTWASPHPFSNSGCFCLVIINRWHNTDLAAASARLRETRALARLLCSRPPR